LREYVESRKIALFEVDVGINAEPFLSMDHEKIREVIKIVTEPSNRPCLIFCTTGRVRTCCVVGCLRRVAQWSLASIMVEFENFAAKEGKFMDMQFIEDFHL